MQEKQLIQLGFNKVIEEEENYYYYVYNLKYFTLVSSDSDEAKEEGDWGVRFLGFNEKMKDVVKLKKFIDSFQDLLS